jgi:hypothetical protein
MSTSIENISEENKSILTYIPAAVLIKVNWDYEPRLTYQYMNELDITKTNLVNLSSNLKDDKLRLFYDMFEYDYIYEDIYKENIPIPEYIYDAVKMIYEYYSEKDCVRYRVNGFIKLNDISTTSNKLNKRAFLPEEKSIQIGIQWLEVLIELKQYDKCITKLKYSDCHDYISNDNHLIIDDVYQHIIKSYIIDDSIFKNINYINNDSELYVSYSNDSVEKQHFYWLCECFGIDEKGEILSRNINLDAIYSCPADANPIIGFPIIYDKENITVKFAVLTFYFKETVLLRTNEIELKDFNIYKLDYYN